MPERIDPVHLREVLTKHFDDGELRELCFDLTVDYDNLSGRNKAEKATELVSHMQRRNQIDDLAGYVRRKREFVQLKTIDTTQSLLNDEKWQADLEKYYASLKQRVGFVRILGRNNAEPLENVFTHVNVLDRPTAEQRYDIKKLMVEFAPRDFGRHARMKRIAGDEAVAEYSKLFVLGKPGAGKTTFMKHTALRAIMGEIDKVPVFVTLKELADSGMGILSFLVYQFEIHQFPQAETFVEHVLRNGDLIVLFDGLDEVNLEGNKRAKLIQALNHFVYQHFDCSIIITCRVAATDYSFTQFEYVEMADFDDEQIGHYIEHWFTNDKVKQINCRKALLDTEEYKAVRELAQVPLLLSLLCLVYEERNEFPPERHEIYEEATRALLSKWDASRNISRDTVYQQLSLTRKRKMLAKIAAQTFEKGDYFLCARDAVRQIEKYLVGVPGLDDPDAEKVLKAMEAQHGIIIERARRIHSFSHLTVQEYFTARYIVDNERRGSVERLMRFVGDDRWHEVFLLTAGMLDDGTEFCELYLVAIGNLLAGDEQLGKLLHWAFQKVSRLLLPYKAAAARAFLINHALARSIDFAFDRALALDHARALALDLALGLDRTLDRTLDLDRARALAFALDVALDRALAHDLARALDRARARDLARAYDLGLDELAADLELLEVPSANAKRKTWQAFSKRLNTVLETYQEQGDIHSKFPVEDKEANVWAALSKEQVELLTRYLEVNNLLVRCLQVAYMPNRQAIEDQILLPPS